jgi:1-acyl-sn-glycerol-3-phosphate acyltransferase
MAKQELFNNLFLRWWLDWLGAFSVNRESLAPSTIKTVMKIKNSDWVLGMFPQGTRGIPGEIKNVSSGFAGLAKITKCAILPVGLTGTNEVKRIPFTGKIVVNIGKPIPYSDNLNEMVNKWGQAVEELTGFKFVAENASEEKVVGVDK